jgi:23S rRNA G2069 N7-methylase RlmK/C1962 C5-methylase RlmI
MDTKLPALLEAAAKARAELKASGVNAVRLVNGFGDALDGLVLEQHGDHFVTQIFDEKWLEEKEALCAFVQSMGAKYFVVKDRTGSPSSDPDALKFHVWIDGEPSTVVEEFGVRFGVNMHDTLNTGLFLDMRANRKRVAALSAGKKVLNLFAYTCAFGVHCRKAGAASVVNVDVSKKSLERGRANCELNGIVPERNEFIRADAMQYLERAVEKDNRFDVIILDPPSFARYEGKTFSVKKDLPLALELCIKILNPGGVLFVATNHSEMLHSNLQNIIKGAAKRRLPKSMECFGQDVDFPGTGFMAESCLTAVLVRY